MMLTNESPLIRLPRPISMQAGNMTQASTRPTAAPVSTVTTLTIRATRHTETTIRKAKFHCVARSKSVNRSTGKPYSQAQGAVSQKNVRKVRKAGSLPFWE